MNPRPLVSIVINNYNYGRYLRTAIDSVLCQTYTPIEVVVVDDGSTDDSREIIASYGNKVAPVFKANGGQSSAFNAGMKTSRGEVICFLDSDDALLPGTIENAVMKFTTPEPVTLVHWPLWVMNSVGNRTGKKVPEHDLAEGDLRDRVLQDGPDAYAHPPTSGLLWARSFLEVVFPLPEREKELRAGTLAADSTLAALAPLYGIIKRLPEPSGCYRLHSANTYATHRFDERLRQDINSWTIRANLLAEHAQRLGFDCRPYQWRERAWICRLAAARDDIELAIPAGQRFLLVDDQQWGMDATPRRQVIPFLERNGMYWGAPADDTTAIRELERLRESGVTHIVFGWPSFWWLDHYHVFAEYLATRHPLVMENDRVKIFALNRPR